MPYLLHRPGVAEPSTLTETDARRVIKSDFPEQQLQNNVWNKLMRGEKIFVQVGQLEWVSDPTTG